MDDVSNQIHFDSLIAMGEKICSVPKGLGSKTEKQRILTCFFGDLRSAAKRQGAGSEEAIYEVIRLVLPDVDLDRNSYSMQEARLARVLMKSLAISPQSSDGKALQEAAKSQGDFSSIVYKHVRNRCGINIHKRGNVTIGHLNSWLDQLARAKTDDQRDEILVEVIKQMTPIQIKWFIRIVLKDLQLGLGPDTIVRCIGGDRALRQFRHTCSLKCLAGEGQDIAEVSLGCPFRPMLSERVNERCMEQMFADRKGYFVQDKLDGERVQMHYSKDGIKFFSRSGLDYSSSYKEVKELAKLTFESIDSCILDGEMMVIDKNTGKMIDKGASPVDVKALNSDEQFSMRYCVFDIIAKNGNSLCEEPFSVRRRILEELFEKEPSPSEHIFCVQCWPDKVTSAEEAVSALKVAVEQKEREGIILKDPESTYVPQGRNACGWYKMKKDYLEETAEDLDLLIVGREIGWKNTAGGGSNHFLVACPSRGDTNKFIICTSINLGFKKHEIAFLLNNFPTKMMKTPEWILNYRKHTASYVEQPQNGVVVQVRAAEIYEHTHSADSVGRIALRFARAVKLRQDKSWDECNTEDDLLNLSKKSVKTTPSKKPLTATNKRKPIGKESSDEQDLPNKHNRGNGFEVCMVISSADLKKSCQEKLEALHDSIEVVSYPGAETKLILVENVESIRAQGFKKLGYEVHDASAWLQTMENE